MFYGHGGEVMDEAMKRTTIDRSTLKRAWQFGKPYKRILAGYLGTAVVVAVLGVVPPIVFKRFLDTAIPTRDLRLVNVLAVIAIALALISAMLSLLIRWYGARIGEGIICDLRQTLFDHVQRMPIAFFTRTQTGSLMSRLNNDVVGAQQAFTATLRNTVNDSLTVVATLIAMTLMSWQMTLLSLIVVPILFFLSHNVGRATQRVARIQMDENAVLNSTMTERFNVSGALLVKLFGRPQQESDEFNSVAGRVRDAGVKRAMTGVVLFIALPMIGALGTASVYWLGARQVIDGTITTGTVVAMAAYVQRLYQPLTELASTRVDFMTAFVSFERVFEVLDAPVLIANPLYPQPFNDNSGVVEFRDVRFAYPAARDVSIASLVSKENSDDDRAGVEILHGLSFVCNPGTLTAIVGPSGAGKSTLVSLIPRLYDATDGQVVVDGLDVKLADIGDLVSRIGVVTQDSHLFHDSIVANLRYAKPDATDAEIMQACKAARIDHLISSLPDQLRTTVGERGYRLSGGEKQRLAIARMLLKDPRIVILDEATAHLDSETEVQIQAALNEALSGRTSIVIAHRLSTIQAADQILVLDAGNIVQRGTHNELIATGGLYRELYETQFQR
jgi:ATP-binding cassette subfamily B protein